MSRRSVITALGLTAALTAVPATASAQGGSGTTVRVTSGADAGPGTFRAAVQAANADPSIERITFARHLTVELSSAVEYLGSQDLEIRGRNAVVSGATGDAAANTTWDGGLFVSRSAADLDISRLTFEDSFNNGIAVFLPADAGDVEFDFHRVAVLDSKFHGIFIDGQASTGFNTDDVLHPACTDPHFVDAAGSIEIDIVRSIVTGNGTLAGGFDDSIATGCPRDFDGVRVDDGVDGDIEASLVRSVFDGNLADGVELDEKGEGSVDARVVRSSFSTNGESGQTVDGLTDLDDGFDIDEEGPGDLIAEVVRSTANDNRDEGLDFDEAGEGSAIVTITQTDADGNEDEGFKVDEEDDGDLLIDIVRSSSTNSLSQDGVDLTEEGDGSFVGEVVRSTITGNDNEAISAEQADAGTGTLRIVRSDLTGNGDPSLDLTGITVEIIRSAID